MRCRLKGVAESRRDGDGDGQFIEPSSPIDEVYIDMLFCNAICSPVHRASSV
jgi:hypothetical protein